MTQPNTDIARSNVQELFIVPETERGVIAYPTKEHFIAVSNDATANQSPEYTDSSEKLGTRDVIERFKNAMPAAQASAAMLLRTGELGEKPQGYDALLSLFGTSTLITPPLFTLGSASASDTVIPLASMEHTAPLPPCGVIETDGELIYYDEISENGGSLLGCVRGYNGTTAQSISGGAANYKSIAFMQADSNPSFSMWLRTDHFVQAITGATVNTAQLSLANDGPVTFDFSSIQGMEMVMAGSSKLKAAATAGADRVKVENPKSYTTKAWVWNPTVGDNGGGPSSGYKVTGIDEASGELILDKPIMMNWPKDSILAGFLPQDAEVIGQPLEGVDTDVFLDGVRGKMRSGSMDYSNNIQYLTDEIGTRFPQGYVEDARTIELTQNNYFRAEDAERFKEGYEGKFMSVRYAFKHGKAVLHLPRVQQTMPTVNIEAPVVSLDISGTALASGRGNNAVYLVIN